MVTHKKCGFFVFFIILALISTNGPVFADTSSPSPSVSPSVADEINQKNQQIQQLQQQIDAYQSQVDQIQSQALTLQSQVDSYDAQISQINLELKSLDISVSSANLQISQTQGQIDTDQDQLTQDQLVLAQYLLLIYKNDQESVTTILLKNDNLSDFFNDLNSINTSQDDLKSTIDSIKTLQTSLEGQKSDLEDNLNDLEQQQDLEQVEKDSVAQLQSQKAELLKETQGQESKFQTLITQSKTDLSTLQSEITYLEQNGVSVEDAVKYGNLAAIAAGIRPAFLLAELEIESGLGENNGKCNLPGGPASKGWKVIMAPRDQQPFLSITASLGLDPDSTPVSCPQYVNGRQYGWGGAMGPAQFIPSTWLGYADKVAQVLGKSVANPFIIEDAFTAAAIKLGNAGATAQTTAAEIAASKAYYSGNPKCSTAPCNSYANAVQREATEIETSL